MGHTRTLSVWEPKTNLPPRDCRWANKWIPEAQRSRTRRAERPDLGQAAAASLTEMDAAAICADTPRLKTQRPGSILSHQSVSAHKHTRELYTETSRTRKHRARYKWRGPRYVYIIEQHMPWGWMTDWHSGTKRVLPNYHTHAIPIQAQKIFCILLFLDWFWYNLLASKVLNAEITIFCIFFLDFCKC